MRAETRPGTQRKKLRSATSMFLGPGARHSASKTRVNALEARPGHESGLRRQRHAFLRRDGDMHRLADLELRLGLGAYPQLAVAGVEELVDHFAQEHPVRDLAGERIEAVAGRLVGEREILRAGRDQHVLTGGDLLPKNA